MSNKLVQSFGRQEFVVPSNVLGLVYAQTVVWMGALFCPLLPLINVAKFIILFYIKKVTDSFNISNLHGKDSFSVFFSHSWILFNLVLNSSINTFFFRLHSLIIAGQRRKRFAPPPPLSFSWWSSCVVGAWP